MSYQLLPRKAGPHCCIWCEDEWPMSRDEPGMHELEADGVYGTAACHKPAEIEKRERHQAPFILADKLWQQSLSEHKAGHWLQTMRYEELLKENGLK